MALQIRNILCVPNPRFETHTRPRLANSVSRTIHVCPSVCLAAWAKWFSPDGFVPNFVFGGFHWNLLQGVCLSCNCIKKTPDTSLTFVWLVFPTVGSRLAQSVQWQSYGLLTDESWSVPDTGKTGSENHPASCSLAILGSSFWEIWLDPVAGYSLPISA